MLLFKDANRMLILECLNLNCHDVLFNDSTSWLLLLHPWNGDLIWIGCVFKSRKWILVSGSSLGGDCPGAGGSTPLLKAESAACRPLDRARVWPLGRAHCQNLQHHLRQGCLLCLLCQGCLCLLCLSAAHSPIHLILDHWSHQSDLQGVSEWWFSLLKD